MLTWENFIVELIEATTEEHVDSAVFNPVIALGLHAFGISPAEATPVPADNDHDGGDTVDGGDSSSTYTLEGPDDPLPVQPVVMPFTEEPESENQDMDCTTEGF
eukprot:13496007-Heterocapsa_arctica.AAC.1